MASGKAKLAGLLVGVVVLGLGCKNAPSWPKNGFLDPSQVGRFSGQSVPQDIRGVISIKDEPLDIESAREPMPQDLVPIARDYQIGPGDVVQVIIYELIAEGTESPFLRQVSETGYITLPEVGAVKFSGLSWRQAEENVAEQLRQGGILRDPRVGVTIMERRHQNFDILGGVLRPGTYPVQRPDFRLLDAVALAGDLQPGIETIYVIRGPDGQAQAGTTQPTAAAVPAAVGPGAGAEMVEPVPVPPVPTEAELQGVMPSNGPVETQPTADQPRKLIAVGDQWVEVPATGPTTGAAAGPATTPAGAAGTVDEAPAMTQATDWTEAVAEAGRQRVVRIPVRNLLHGDPQYNIVIRPNDRVYAWIGPVGEFYVVGQVFQPGVFSLTGRRVTVRQAIAAARGLAPLAWPDRAELVRRYNDNQEEIIQLNLDAIFAGTQPDVVLKPNDVLNVGSHPIAPFMATVRNAFRLTYGFGFVYDRNFADIDAYAARQNPTDVRRAQRQQLFGSLFR